MPEASDHIDIEVGTVVGGTYEVTALLGRGGMGSVWRASHARLPGKEVAIKVLHTDVAGDPESLARFRREAEIASRLGHPNIVEVHDFNTLASGAPYLVLEILAGESLDERLAGGPLAPDHVSSIVRQIGSGLRAAHEEGIVHRDLKPQNVFLARAGDGSETAKILDFGISKIRGSQTVETKASSLLGTPQYMAPEQAVGKHAEVDARTDVFALGAMTYEMLSGRSPFQGQTIPEVVFKVVYEDPAPLAELAPSAPAEVCEAVHTALAKEQGDRFQDVGAMVAALTGAPLSSVPTMRRQAEREDRAAKASAGAVGTDETAAPANVGLGTDETAAPANVASAAGAAAQQAAPANVGLGTDETAAPANVASAAGAAAQQAAPAQPAPLTETPGVRSEDARAPARRSLKGAVMAIGFALVGAAGAAFVLTQPWASAEEEPPEERAGEGGAVEPGDEAGDAAELAAEGRDFGGEGGGTGVGSGTGEGGGTGVGGGTGEGGGTEGHAGPDQDGADDADEAGDRPSGEGGAGDDGAAGAGAELPQEGEADRPAEGARGGGDQGRAADREPEEDGGGTAGGIPDEVRAVLDEAATALADGDEGRALELVERAELEEVTPRGFAIRARAHCTREDLANARAAWRNLPEGPLRDRVEGFCERYNIHL